MVLANRATPEFPPSGNQGVLGHDIQNVNEVLGNLSQGRLFGTWGSRLTARCRDIRAIGHGFRGPAKVDT